MDSYNFNIMPIGNVAFGTCLRMFATPFFFLTMGAFMSSKTPYRNQLSRFIKKLLIPCIFTILFLIQLTPLAKGEVGAWGVLTKLHVDFTVLFWSLSTISISRHYPGLEPLWFVECLVLCYILLPVFKIFLHDSPIDNRYKKNLFYVATLVFIVPSTLKAYIPNPYLQQMTTISEYPFLWVWLLLLGNYIHIWIEKNKEAIKTYIIWLVPLIFLCFCIVNFYLAEKYDLDENLKVKHWSFTLMRSNITVFIANLLPFIWFHCIDIKNVLNSKIILNISEKCFYMYLTHMTILIFLRSYVGVNGNRFLGNFIHWIACIVLSFLVACILKTIERHAYALAGKGIEKLKYEIIFIRGRMKEIS